MTVNIFLIKLQTRIIIGKYVIFGTQIKEEKDRPGTDQTRQGGIGLTRDILGLNRDSQGQTRNSQGQSRDNQGHVV